jgi:hypothetical protein
VHVERDVDVQHFVLDAPRRVVLDPRRRHAPDRAARYDGTSRGGVVTSAPRSTAPAWCAW